MSTPISRSGRWRRALAAGAAMALPFSVAACGDDGNDDPDVINEEQVDDEVQDEVDDAEKELEEQTDELEEETDQLNEDDSSSE